VGNLETAKDDAHPKGRYTYIAVGSLIKQDSTGAPVSGQTWSMSRMFNIASLKHLTFQNLAPGHASLKGLPSVPLFPSETTKSYTRPNSTNNIMDKLLKQYLKSNQPIATKPAKPTTPTKPTKSAKPTTPTKPATAGPKPASFPRHQPAGARQ
jgi:hypothetical protein